MCSRLNKCKFGVLKLSIQLSSIKKHAKDNIFKGKIINAKKLKATFCTSKKTVLVFLDVLNFAFGFSALIIFPSKTLSFGCQSFFFSLKC